MADQALVFAVRRRDPELVGPAAPTPRETKRLSDIDNQNVLRIYVSLAFFYRGREDAVAPADPAGVVRRALGEALVHYYPLAGRLREVEGRKLVVDCTGEGVLFVEAEADVRLAELQAAGLRPPIPCMDQLLLEVEGSSGTLGTPLMLIQVTRLLCGGFVLALRHSHAMCDAIGIAQFINAVAELARGLPAPTVAPAWSRELLEVPRAPASSFPRSESAAAAQAPQPVDADMVVRSFTFGPSEVAAIKKRLPPLLRDTATTFEALAAFLWRARTAALEFPPDDDAPAPLAILANFRAAAELGLPSGYYGNAAVPTLALADAAALRRGSLEDAVALVRHAKVVVTADYVRSRVEELALGGRPPLNKYLLSDLRRAGFHRVDFGWGKPVFGGPVYHVFGISFFIAFTDQNGEDAVVVPVALPRQAMERFAVEMESLFVSKL
ncbi:benzyl alcohol O-benzoyltransferase-like [Lolium rigidum]|uniref:benzyl alcohol O-benzoyltransferase-like n=1 Tax=Lolium rigidum TaxID=89674 RepID=UPI001F5DA00B|nr:benzyl alcohol O-benzoyltransferase-like [Lolium rigidum]